MSSRARRALTGVAGAAGMIAVLTLASRVVGFVRWLVQSWTLEGGSATAGAYATANQIPNVLYEVVAGGALAGAIVPLLAAPLARRLHDEVDRTASALMTWMLLGLVPLGVLVAVLAGPIASFIPMEGDAQRDLMTYLLRVFAVQIPLYGFGVVLTGVLQAQRRFFWPAIAPLLSSVVVLVSYVLFGALADGAQNDPAALSGTAVAWLAWGTTAGVAAMSLPLLVPVHRAGVRLRPALRFPPGVASRAWHLGAAGLGGLIAQQASVALILYLAPLGGHDGTLSVYQYAQAVYLLPYAVLAVPLATAVFPRLAEKAADRPAFADLAARSTRTVLAVSLVGVAVLVAVAPAATAVFSLRAEMPGMTQAVTTMAPGVVGMALVFHVTRVLYALDRGRTAVIATATGWGVVALGSWVLVWAWAGDGGDQVATLTAFGVATAVGMSVAGVLLLAGLRRAAGAAALTGTARTLLVAGTGAGVGALVGRFAADAVLDLAGTGALTGVMAAALGAIVAGGAVAGAVTALDRSTVRLPGRAEDDHVGDTGGRR